MNIKNNWKELIYKQAFETGKKQFNVEEVVKLINSFKDRDYIHSSIRRKQLIQFINEYREYPLKYREIGRALGDSCHPQVVKYHLEKLEEDDIITIDRENKIIHYIEIID